MEDRWIILNRVKCLECGEILISQHRHDYNTCGCPNHTGVDGGGDYLRCGGKEMSKVNPIPVYSDAPFEIIRDSVYRGSRGRLGNEPLKYIKLSEIDNEYLQAIIDYEEELRPMNKYLPIYKQEQKFRKNEL
jgi:hypothetical protein